MATFLNLEFSSIYCNLSILGTLISLILIGFLKNLQLYHLGFPKMQLIYIASIRSKIFQIMMFG